MNINDQNTKVFLQKYNITELNHWKNSKKISAALVKEQD